MQQNMLAEANRDKIAAKLADGKLMDAGGR